MRPATKSLVNARIANVNARKGEDSMGIRTAKISADESWGVRTAKITSPEVRHKIKVSDQFYEGICVAGSFFMGYRKKF